MVIWKTQKTYLQGFWITVTATSSMLPWIFRTGIFEFNNITYIVPTYVTKRSLITHAKFNDFFILEDERFFDRFKDCTLNCIYCIEVPVFISSKTVQFQVRPEVPIWTVLMYIHRQRNIVEEQTSSLYFLRHQRTIFNEDLRLVHVYPEYSTTSNYLFINLWIWSKWCSGQIVLGNLLKQLKQNILFIQWKSVDTK